MVNFLGTDIDAEVKDYQEIDEIIETGIIKKDPFNVAPLLDLFKKFHHEIDAMANKAMGISVTDDASLNKATTYTTQAKALAQAIEKKRVEVKAPYLEVVRVLDGETKQLKDRTAQIQQHLNGKIRPYLTKKEQERQEAERKAQEEAARIQAELDAKAKADQEAAFQAAKQAAVDSGMSGLDAEAAGMEAAGMIEPAPVVVAPSVPTETKVQTESGTAKLKEEWTFTIEDSKALPDAAFEARKAEVIKALSPWVNAQVKAGSRNIPGVKIFKQAKIETRTSKSNFKF